MQLDLHGVVGQRTAEIALTHVRIGVERPTLMVQDHRTVDRQAQRLGSVL
jgi:hypothetical protein